MKQFEMTRDMMRAVGGMGMMGKLKLMKSLMSGNLAGPGHARRADDPDEKERLDGAEGSE